MPTTYKTLLELGLADLDINVSALAIDSRHVTPGSLFFAYPGTAADGRHFITEAITRGARAIVYEDNDGFKPQIPAAATTVFIPKTEVQMIVGAIAATFFGDPSAALNIIGVTGTNGKTSITHFIAQALQKHKQRCAVLGTLGNGELSALAKATQTTLGPIELQRCFAEFKQAGIGHVAMEVSSHALVQGRVAGVHFTTAVFTQLSRDHLDYHGSMQAYADAKGLLFQQPGLQHAVINQDDEHGRQYIAHYGSKLKVVTYSALGQINTQHNYVVAQEIIPQAHGFLVKVETSWGLGELLCPLLGLFNISNVLATLAVLLINKIPFSEALSYCSSLSVVAGRMQALGGGSQPQVVVDYAHTPDALEKALHALRSHCQGKLWCVFGCGGDRDRGKRPLMAAVAEQFADCVIVTDDNPRTEASETIVNDIIAGFAKAEAVQVIQDRDAAIAMAVQSAKRHDIVLVAGKGHETTQTIGCRVLPFDDVEHVKLALASLK